MHMASSPSVWSGYYMTQKQIADEYTVENGIIRSPGKFEGQPSYAVHFYDMWNNGFLDEDCFDGELEHQCMAYCNIDSDDIAEFPELKGIDCMTIHETGYGFVYMEESKAYVQVVGTNEPVPPYN